MSDYLTFLCMGTGTVCVLLMLLAVRRNDIGSFFAVFFGFLLAFIALGIIGSFGFGL